jgi:AcrR family transcriptional regulator
MFTTMSTRPYRQHRRLESQAETRRRIVEATAALHEEVGPAATTISGIAERAGVQRLTVYRHFPDERALFEACSAHWSAAHPAPDPATWAGVRDPRRRLETALTALYDYYRRGATMLEKVLRDSQTEPVLAEVVAPFQTYLDGLAADLTVGWSPDPKGRPMLRAAIGHALEFETWRSLALRGVGEEDAARLMAGMASASVRARASARR